MVIMLQEVVWIGFKEELSSSDPTMLLSTNVYLWIAGLKKKRVQYIYVMIKSLLM